jgi:hypothetical protein
MKRNVQDVREIVLEPRNKDGQDWRAIREAQRKALEPTSKARREACPRGGFARGATLPLPATSLPKNSVRGEPQMPPRETCSHGRFGRKACKRGPLYSTSPARLRNVSPKNPAAVNLSRYSRLRRFGFSCWIHWSSAASSQVVISWTVGIVGRS